MAIQSIGTYIPPLVDSGEKGTVRTPAPGHTGAVAQDVLENPTAVQAAGEQQKPTRHDLEKALKSVNEFVQAKATDVEFKLDDDTGIRIIKVVDRSSKEVIRQIPSEEMLKIAKALDQLQGMLIRQTA